MRIPPRTKVLARSVAPVKSSAIQPSSNFVFMAGKERAMSQLAILLSRDSADHRNLRATLPRTQQAKIRNSVVRANALVRGAGPIPVKCGQVSAVGDYRGRLELFAQKAACSIMRAQIYLD